MFSTEVGKEIMCSLIVGVFSDQMNHLSSFFKSNHKCSTLHFYRQEKCMQKMNDIMRIMHNIDNSFRRYLKQFQVGVSNEKNALMLFS